MGRYVIAIGGTGNKILESMVYAACADAFYTLDEDGRRRPIPQLRMLSVDVDAACGNTTRAKRAAEYYEQVREAFSAAPVSHACFHTRLSVDKWTMNLSRRAASVRQMSQNHAQDRLLARALFSATEADLEYSEGFRGHPNLGVLFFNDLLGGLEEARRLKQPDEFDSLIAAMESDIMDGEPVQLLLCGSIFGGTGASGIPAISQYLHTRFDKCGELFTMGAILMLPYYSVPDADVDPTREIAVDSSEFLDKARTALQYYGMEGMIRDGKGDRDGVFDAVYLLGLPPEHFVRTRMYSTGSQSQENDAHLLEWLAARCAARFFQTDFTSPRSIDCYYYQWHTPAFCWASFDQEAALYHARYGALMKAAAVFLSECYPTLRAFADGARGLSRVGYCAAYFHRLRHAGAGRRAQLKSRLEALYHFFAFYVNWCFQVLHTLPPTMRDAAGADGVMDADTLNLLHDILAQYGEDGRADAADRRQLQRSLRSLVSDTTADRRGIDRVVSGLGGGECAGDGPDAAFASFLAALLSCVMEDI